METPKPILSSLLPLILLLSIFSGNYLPIVEAKAPSNYHRRRNSGGDSTVFQPSKLFVFGDSYADTGNGPIATSSSWKIPYGITYPGKPTGRFSDGRVLTDFVGKYYGLLPIPYKWRKIGSKYLKYGINFATGGTGVFDTVIAPLGPNMTTQIDYFQNLIGEDKLYTTADLNSSLVLVTLSGNDYTSYLATNGTIQGLPTFITQVVNQLAINIKRIKDLGVRKVVVGAIQPVGCLPSSTITDSFQQCNTTYNTLAMLHNQLLQQAVANYNNESNSIDFTILDLFSVFFTVLQNNGTVKFENPLTPCCLPVSSEYNCGDVDADGVKKYTVCENPSMSFFWDMNHPTQEGWNEVFGYLESTLEQL